MTLTTEIQVFPMITEQNGDSRLVQDGEAAQFYDVTYSERDDETGAIEPLEEHEGLSEVNAGLVAHSLMTRFPRASFEWVTP